MGKQERLDRKGDKSDSEFRQEVGKTYNEYPRMPVELFAEYKSLVEDDSVEATLRKDEIKEEFHKHYPFKDFEKAAADALEPAAVPGENREEDGGVARPGEPGEPGAPEGPGGNREEIITGIKLSLEELKSRIENYKENENSALLAVQRLNEKGLTPVDLRGGNRQFDAIDAVFGNNPNVAYTLKLGIKEKPAEYSPILDSVANVLSSTFEKMREVEKGHELYQEDVLTEFLGNRWNNLKDSFVENPVTSLLALGGVALFTKWAYNKYDWVKNWLPTVAGGTLAVWGLNHISGMLSNDGKSVISRFMWNANTFDRTKVTTEYHGMLETMNDSNRHAVDAMLHLGEARSSAIAAAFGNALRTNQTEIDPYDIVGEGNITPDEARMINKEGMYTGLENLMYEIAEKKLGKTEKNAETLHEALNYFKNHYASNGKDFKLMYVYASLYASESPDNHNEDGSAAPGDRMHRREGEEALSDEEQKQIDKIRSYFTEIGVEGVDVSGRPGGYVTLNDYPLSFEYNKEEDTLTLTDTVTPSLTWKITKNKEGKAMVETSIMPAIATEMRSRVAAQGGTGLTVEYKKEKSAWMLVPGLKSKKILGMELEATAETRVRAIEKRKNLEFLLEGFPLDHFATPEAARIKLAKLSAQKKFNEDLGFLLGDVNIVIDDLSKAPKFEFKYGNALGEVVYAAGAVTNLTLPENAVLLNGFDARALAEARSYMETTEVKTVFNDLEAAFAAQWGKGGYFKMLERWSAIASNKWYGETPVFYGREEVWSETVGFKKREIEMFVQNAVFAAIRKDLPKNKADYEASVSRALTQVTADLQALKNSASRISSLNLADGAAMENALVGEAKNLDMFAYKNPDYAQFVIDLEKMMAEGGYDFVGVEQFAHARKIRDEIRLTVLDYSEGISFEDPSTLTPAERQTRKDYLIYLLAEVRATFNDAQHNKALNKGWLDFSNSGIAHSSFVEALRRRSVKRYSEYDAKYFAAPGVVPPLITMPITPGTTAPETLGAKMENFKVELNKRFEPIEDMEWAWGATQYQVFVGLYKARYIDTYAEILQKPIVGPVLKEPDVELLERLDNELLSLARYTSSPTVGSKPQLREVERVINKSMLDNSANWGDPAFEVLEFLSGKYEFENILQINQPSIWESYLKIYYDKINYGENSADARDAKAYTDFFVFEMSKVLSQDKNIALDNLNWVTIEESMKDWTHNVPLVRQIPSYDEWLVSYTTRPRVDFLNRPLKAAEVIEKEKRDVAEQFMKNFDAKIDVNQLMRIDSNWGDSFRQHVEERLMLEIYPRFTTAEDLKMELHEFGKFIYAERQFYEILITQKLDTDTRLSAPIVSRLLPPGMRGLMNLGWGSWLDLKLHEVMDRNYKTYFNATPKDLKGFADALNKEAGDLIDQAGVEKTNIAWIVGMDSATFNIFGL